MYFYVHVYAHVALIVTSIVEKCHPSSRHVVFSSRPSLCVRASLLMSPHFLFFVLCPCPAPLYRLLLPPSSIHLHHTSLLSPAASPLWIIQTTVFSPLFIFSPLQVTQTECILKHMITRAQASKSQVLLGSSSNTRCLCLANPAPKYWLARICSPHWQRFEFRVLSWQIFPHFQRFLVSFSLWVLFLFF